MKAYTEEQIDKVISKPNNIKKFLESKDGIVRLSKEDLVTLENVVRDNFITMMDKVYDVASRELSYGPIDLDEFDHDALEQIIVEIVHDYFRSGI